MVGEGVDHVRSLCRTPKACQLGVKDGFPGSLSLMDKLTWEADSNSDVMSSVCGWSLRSSDGIVDPPMQYNKTAMAMGWPSRACMSPVARLASRGRKRAECRRGVVLRSSTYIVAFVRHFLGNSIVQAPSLLPRCGMVRSSPSTAGHHEPPVTCGASAKETSFEALIDIEVFASSHRLALVDMGETQDAWSPSRLCLSTMTKPILPWDGIRDSNWNGSRGSATPSVQCRISISEANPRTPATVSQSHTPRNPQTHDI